MPNYAVARVSKQKGGSVGASGHHNDRTRETLNADPDRRDLNKVLIGDDRNVRELVSEVIEAHGGKPRRDSVEALELVLTATREHFTDARGEISQDKVDRFVERAVAFLEDPRSGGVCVKAVLHMDERTPHVQAHKVPITPEGKLSCKHYFGEKRQWVEFQDLYHEYMKDLGLERGERGSFAKHTDIQKFYGAITRDHRLRLDLERLPDPPKVAVTKEAVRKYKREVVEAVNEQVKEPLRTLNHQAMLTREEASKREAAERREAERVAEAERRARLAEERLLAEVRARNELGGRLSRLEHSHTTVRSELLKEREKSERFATLAGQLQERLRDIPLPDVMARLGYRGEQSGERVVYRDDQGRVALTIRGGEVSGAGGRVVCRNSIDLVCRMRNEYGEGGGAEFTQGDAFTWLARTFGAERAVAAYLVEREQAITAALGTNRPGREAAQRSQEQGRGDPAERERQSYGFDR